MKQLLKHLAFWRKFSRFLLVGFSCLILLYFFQSEEAVLSAQTACEVGAVTITNPSSGAQLPANTSSTNLTWTAASGATHYDVSVFGDPQFYQRVAGGTSVPVPLKNGKSYRASIRPYNLSTGCNTSGGLYESTFSVGGTPPSTGGGSGTCSNQPVLCQGESNDEGDDGSYWSYPDPNNNCIVPACSGQGGSSTGQFSCNIRQEPLYAQGSVNFRYRLVAESFSAYAISTYEWDLYNNGSIDSRQPTYEYDFPNGTNTSVRLRLIDNQGRTGSCFTNVNPPGSCTLDRISCPDGSTVGRNPNNSCQFYACPSINQCRSMSCSAPSGCYYTNPQLSYSCDPSAQLCGSLICPPVIPPNIPSFPNMPIGDLQQTIVDIVNENINRNTNTNTSNSTSSSSATGGYSYAGGGSAGSATVDIKW
ncbi:hypothetical protein HYS92_02000 [Candidatus Daviesbacteria bacterium]|nr:hypothetical protein [Candidatus Daviesbacteria bacterium]